MYCERTDNEKFALQDLPVEYLEIIQYGLVVLKSSKLTDADQFAGERKKAIEMYQAIDCELIAFRQEKTRTGLAPVQVEK